MALLNFYHPLVFGVDANMELQKVHKLMSDMVKDYKGKSDSNNASTRSSVGSSLQAGVGRLLEYDQFVNRLLAESSGGKNELDSYLEDNVLRRSDDFDILNWWKANATKYPTLALIARDILAIPVSTVASESAFSAGGRLISTQRSRLHTKTVEALMCTQSWLLNHIKKGNLIYI
ncbi:Putative AC9 transposase [Linum perenne]